MNGDPGGFGYLCQFVHRINSRGVLFSDDPLNYSVPLFLLQLSFLSIITGFFQFILKPLGQPLIVSQILGGVFLGPSVLGLNGTFLEKVFPIRGRAVLDTLSVFGMMFFSFVVGVKVDPTMVIRSGRKALAVGTLGFFIPYALASLVAFLLKEFSSLDLSISKALPHIVLMQSMTAFPVITFFLDELKILNSEIGRLASYSSIISDVYLWFITSMMFVTEMAKSKPLRVVFGSIFSGILFSIFIVFGVRPAALWVIRQTPEGKPVKEIYIFSVLVLLLACGFTGELMGFGALLGCVALGLVIPDGPPLGAAIVERLDCFVSVLLMPFFFLICGLHVDIFSIQKLKNVGLLQLVVLVAFLGKLIGTTVPLLFCRMPFRDAFSLGLIMNSKGIVELIFLNDFHRAKIVSEECYAIMVISMLVITIVISPIVKVMYDPSKRYIAYKRRTILHSRKKDELRMLVCIHNQENARAVISLLQVSNPTKDSPINLVVLHLVKLMGRASSLLVAHRPHEELSLNASQSERIFNAFKKLEQKNEELVTVNAFKGISPFATMDNDVCFLALEKRTILILLPFLKQWEFSENVDSSYAYRHLCKNVLEKAPCSVGILIYGENRKKRQKIVSETSPYRTAVLFFGGADDREALAFGRRMVDNTDVTLTIKRFMALGTVEIVNGTERSKMLDAEILDDLKLKMQTNDRIKYQEEVMTSGVDVVSSIRSLGNAYDLIMVGRRHGDSPIICQLKKFSQHEEFGSLGEILASSHFKGEASVLVVQQQTRLWGLKDPEESLHLRRINL